jgi:2-polyprenyl-6-methoxyphenol hydroxylase-like FAD-dependent oxidoreductase
VIGGGSSRLMIASLLQQQGIDCVVFDKLTRNEAEERPRASFSEWRKKLLLERGTEPSLC